MDRILSNLMRNMRVIILVLLLSLSSIVGVCSGGTLSTVKDDFKQTNPTFGISQVIELSEAEFAEKVYDYKENKVWEYKGTKPAVVEFYTVWCGACKRMLPRLERLAQEFSGKVIIYRVNAEKASELSDAIKIQAYPTLLFIPTDGTPSLSIGLISLKQMRSEVEKIRKNKP